MIAGSWVIRERGELRLLFSFADGLDTVYWMRDHQSNMTIDTKLSPVQFSGII